MNKHGFQLIREEVLKEVGGTIRFWKHINTGAELLSIVNKDENKSFGVAFRTPPADSTGVAHILEHSVLCGSAKYPLKDPFVELVKGSLNTFLNALTFPDKTCYPVASCNLQDFYNLIDVYLDAVFHPRIDENVFRQEGWHIEAPSVDAPWEFRGVVYNEMKGVYSSPDSVLQEQCQHAVFPDTLYSYDSGGYPKDIPTLTFEAFRKFHAEYYHPSNARFFFWGDDDEDVRLEKIEAVLTPYSSSPVHSQISLQPVLPAPSSKVKYYAASADDADAKAQVAVNWLLCETSHTEEIFILQILEHILAALPGSPLRKALMDSGLGDDIVGCGVEAELRQAYFSMGLHGVAPENRDKVEPVIMSALKKLAKKGIPPFTVEASLNAFEFTLRENNTGRFPRGLDAFFRSLSSWLYDGDPFAPLAWEQYLNSIKKRLANGEKLFENAIRRYFLENTHRITVAVLPDAELAEKQLSEEKERVEAIRTKADKREREQLVQLTETLRLEQQTPDTPEALSTIPYLKVKDLDRQGREYPITIEEVSPYHVVTHDINTDGILYAYCYFDASALPDRLLPLFPVYCRALIEMGTKEHDFVDLGLEITAKTGGMVAAPTLVTLPKNNYSFGMSFLAKCTQEKLSDLISLLKEVWLKHSFINRERFTQIIMEECARYEQMLIPSGNAMVNLRLSGHYSEAGRISEEMNGITNLFFMRDLLGKVQKNWYDVLTDLEEIHIYIIKKNGLKLDLTAESSFLEKCRRPFEDLINALPDFSSPATFRMLSVMPENEVLAVPSQVNYVGMSLNLLEAGYKYHGSMSVILRHLSMGYLWERVRVRGGAYGCSARYSKRTGTFLFSSYRDPSVAGTLSVYKNTADYLGNLTLAEEEISRAIVGAIGGIDSYILPSARGQAAFIRWMSRETKEERQRIREEILTTKLSDFHALASHLAQALNKTNICVLGGTEAEKEATEKNWVITRVL